MTTKKTRPAREPAPSSNTIARGHTPLERQPNSGTWGPENPAPPTPKKPDPTPEEEDALIARGTLIALLYAQCGSYKKVADLFELDYTTVRYWVHKHRARRPEELQQIAARLKADVAQLAVDRVMEGLVEGDTEFAATLGTKILHGLGELKNHTTDRTPAPTTVTTLTLNIVRDPHALPNAPPPEVIEGAVVGVPYPETDAPVQTAALDGD